MRMSRRSHLICQLALIEQQPIPEIEEHPYVGDSVGGVEYVSGFLTRKCGEDGAEPKEGSWTSLQDYGDLENPILTHATELTVEQTQVCSKLFNCFHGEWRELGNWQRNDGQNS